MKSQFHSTLTTLTNMSVTASASCTRLVGVALLGATLVLAGCQSTGKSQVAVGPSVGPTATKALGDTKKQYEYNSEIYLDVAIPIFNPGIPEDFDELKDKSIWPQLRRAEANRFALITKRALENTKAFGNISVVPSPQATADLYVLGHIDESNSEDVKITIELVDITGRRWDKESFEHRVSEGFFRDKKTKVNDPYEPIFVDIADHIFNMLTGKKEQEKNNIKQITDIRFAQSFSPETFSKHLSTDRKGYVTLNSLPSKNDPMMSRIEPLRIQEQLFIDRLQTQYEGFAVKTDASYHKWQENTLPAIVAAREAENKTILAGLIGGAAIVLAAVNAKHDLSGVSQVATGAVAIAGAYMIKESFGSNDEAKVHRATIDEMGESLDLEVDPHVMTLEDKSVELTGTSQEQYIQWKAHLQRIYELENTPEKDL